MTWPLEHTQKTAIASWQIVSLIPLLLKSKNQSEENGIIPEEFNA